MSAPGSDPDEQHAGEPTGTCAVTSDGWTKIEAPMIVPTTIAVAWVRRIARRRERDALRHSIGDSTKGIRREDAIERLDQAVGVAARKAERRLDLEHVVEGAVGARAGCRSRASGWRHRTASSPAGSRVSRSRTSSSPRKRPSPRASPAIGCRDTSARSPSSRCGSDGRGVVLQAFLLHHVEHREARPRRRPDFRRRY